MPDSKEKLFLYNAGAEYRDLYVNLRCKRKQKMCFCWENIV